MQDKEDLKNSYHCSWEKNAQLCQTEISVPRINSSSLSPSPLTDTDTMMKRTDSTAFITFLLSTLTLSFERGNMLLVKITSLKNPCYDEGSIL